MKTVLPWIAAACIGCGTAPEGGSAPATTLELLLPVDIPRVGSADVMTWPHRQRAEADLNGDGRAEVVMVAADVTLDAAGEPLWEDGHRWVVLVDDPPAQTLVYGGFVPNGHVEAAITAAAGAGRRRVLVVERTPQRLRAWEIAYDAPDDARTVSATESEVERWVPSLVTP